MKKPIVSTRWFPSCAFSENNSAFTDNTFLDFEQQSAQLSGPQQTYTQLSKGQFQGRFLSAYLGDDVAIHMEYCNQKLEQEIAEVDDYYCFGLLLSEQTGFYANGKSLSMDNVFLLPKTQSLHMISPNNGAVMAIIIKRSLFQRYADIAPDVIQWLESLNGSIGLLSAKGLSSKGLSAKGLAEQIREDAVSALESATKATEQVIGQALAVAILTKLTLLWHDTKTERIDDQQREYKRFHSIRQQLIADLSDHNYVNDSSHSKEIDWGTASKRSIEQAFKRSVAIGPITYLRILRLHKVRRKLSSMDHSHQSIGDIAAQFGFWDWSRFSQLYARHFGESPSITRLRFQVQQK